MKSNQMTQEQAEIFVRLWQDSKSGALVGKMLGLSRQRVHQIAERMRLAGIPLKRGNYDKRKERVESNWDIEKLKQIIQEGK